MPQSNLVIRPAHPEEVPALNALIEASARALSLETYTQAEIDACVAYVFGVDSELVGDQTYYVVEYDGALAACGGWSRRKTLFGGDQYEGRASGFLDPASEAAKIRAFFVHPDFARRGIGRALLEHCEHEARRHGFSHAEMMATLPGIRLYEAAGYRGEAIVHYPAPDGTQIRFMPMVKSLA